MKVGIDISQIVYQGTGVASYTSSLVEAFSRVGTDNQYVLFGSSLRNNRILRDFVKKFDKEVFKHKFSFLPPKFLEILWNGIHLVPIETFTGNLDIFHSSDWLEPPTARAKKVTTVHDFIVYKYPETFSPRGGHNIVTNQKRKLFFVKHYSDLIIAVSQTTKQDAMEILKIPEKKIRVIYEAADPFYFPRDQDRISKTKEKFKIRGDYFLCVGTREPRKNIGRVIMAFAQLPKEFLGFSLVIAGKYGWGDENQISKIKNPASTAKRGEQRLDSRVKILGYTEKEDLASLYSGTKAFVYPSLYEGFGLPILEAMACGAPVVTSNIGSMKEIASGVAFLCNPESVESIAGAMLKITKEDQNGLRQKSLVRAGEFSWDKTSLQTLEAYHSLLE